MNPWWFPPRNNNAVWEVNKLLIPSGYVKIAIEIATYSCFIQKNMIFHSYVSLPEGNNWSNSLGGWWFTYPSENMSSYEFVSWDDYSQYMEKTIQMFQTTNQSWWFVDTLPNSLTLGGINGKQIQQSLVGGFNPSEKYEFVSWDDEIPNIWKII